MINLDSPILLFESLFDEFQSSVLVIFEEPGMFFPHLELTCHQSYDIRVPPHNQGIINQSFRWILHKAAQDLLILGSGSQFDVYRFSEYKIFDQIFLVTLSVFGIQCLAIPSQANLFCAICSIFRTFL